MTPVAILLKLHASDTLPADITLLVGAVRSSTSRDGNNGNMVLDGTRSISYNYDNMPASITAGSDVTTFVYDGAGARVKKIWQAGSSEYTKLYIGKLYECSADSCSDYIYAGGQLIARKISGTSHVDYYHTDNLGSISVVTDETGAKLDGRSSYGGQVLLGILEEPEFTYRVS